MRKLYIVFGVLWAGTSGTQEAPFIVLQASVQRGTSAF